MTSLNHSHFKQCQVLEPINIVEKEWWKKGISLSKYFNDKHYFTNFRKETTFGFNIDWLY